MSQKYWQRYKNNIYYMSAIMHVFGKWYGQILVLIAKTIGNRHTDFISKC